MANYNLLLQRKRTSKPLILLEKAQGKLLLNLQRTPRNLPRGTQIHLKLQKHQQRKEPSERCRQKIAPQMLDLLPLKGKRLREGRNQLHQGHLREFQREMMTSRVLRRELLLVETQRRNQSLEQLVGKQRPTKEIQVITWVIVCRSLEMPILLHAV